MKLIFKEYPSKLNASMQTANRSAFCLEKRLFELREVKQQSKDFLNECSSPGHKELACEKEIDIRSL